MILVFDIGNTNVVFGVYEKRMLQHEFRLATDLSRTGDEYLLIIRGLLSSVGILDAESIEGAIISSVVPDVGGNVRRALLSLMKKEPIIVSHTCKLSFDIITEDPSILGADFICAAEGALCNDYQTPIIVVDLGTATKLLAVDENRQFLGVSILAGLKVSMNALVSGTALLAGIPVTTKAPVIGTDTKEALASGLLHGTAAMLEGMVARYEEEMGKTATVVITGGFSQVVHPYLKRDMVLKGDLILDGLFSIYENNKETIEKE